MSIPGAYDMPLSSSDKRLDAGLTQCYLIVRRKWKEGMVPPPVSGFPYPGQELGAGAFVATEVGTGFGD